MKGLKFHSTRCFNCETLGHLRKDCYCSVTKRDTSLEDNQNRKPQPSGICRKCGEGTHWTNECRSKKDMHGNPLSSGNWMTGLVVGPGTNNKSDQSAVSNGMAHQQSHRRNVGSALEINACYFREPFLTLAPQIPCYKMATGMYGPLTQGIIFGGNLLTTQGFIVYPGITDED